MAAYSVASCTLSEPTELQATLQTLRLQGVLLNPDRFEGSVTAIDFGDFMLEIVRASPALMIGAAEQGRAGCLLMLDGLDRSKWDGRRIEECDVAALGPGASLIGSFHDPFACGFISANENDAEWIPGPWRERNSERRGGARVQRATQQAHSRLAGWMRRAEQAALHAPDMLRDDASRNALRDTLVAATVDLFASAELNVPARNRAARRHRMVRLVDEYLCANPVRPVYTDDLCRTLGVSASALHEAFHTVLGISPHRYLKLRRMSLVRAALLSPSGPWHSVKAAALSYGFWHLSQFAQDYREIYGELPSATLARAQPEAVE